MLIQAPKFDFRVLVLSHGWAFLPPFTWDDAASVLARPLRLLNGATINLTLKPDGPPSHGRIRAILPGERSLSPPDRQQLRRQVVRMLRLNEPFDAFHKLCAADPLLSFAAQRGCGGLLRAPTAFEDLIKTACTTNCDWNNTKRMCEALCSLDAGAFPGPEVILKFTPGKLARLVPLGYRVRTVRQIARLTAAGKLDLDAWAAAGDFDRAQRQLRAIWGIGPYAAAHMMVLLGSYTQVPVDSEVTKYLKATHGEKRRAGHQEWVAHYERFHPYQFLAYKFSRIGRNMNYIDK